MASLLDVAREANVATSTVSRVINGTARISRETQQRVHDAIKRVGYRPRTAGRPRKRSRNWNIGALYTPRTMVSGSLVSTSRDWITGIRQAVIAADGHLEVYAGANHIDQDMMYRHSVENGDLHGLVIMGAARRDGYLDDAKKRGLPVVVMNDRSMHGEFSSVYADLYGGGWMAAEYLIGLGHRRFAMVNSPLHTVWAVDQRYQGALDALRHHGIEPVIDRHGSVRFEDKHLFEQGPASVIEHQVTAVLCGDYAAVRYVDALHRRGVRVPEDVSVVGFDDLGILPDTGQKLTTIGYDKVRMGRMALSILMKLIRSRGRVRHLEVSLPTFLVQGQTAASVPKD